MSKHTNQRKYSPLLGYHSIASASLETLTPSRPTTHRRPCTRCLSAEGRATPKNARLIHVKGCKISCSCGATVPSTHISRTLRVVRLIQIRMTIWLPANECRPSGIRSAAWTKSIRFPGSRSVVTCGKNLTIEASSPCAIQRGLRELSVRTNVLSVELDLR
jgi:hypothetical protein